MGQLIYLDECLMGLRRGAHKDGAHVCPQFLFSKPANHNDISAFNCSNCGRPDAEHIVIEEPKPPARPPGPAMRPPPAPASGLHVQHASKPASPSGGAQREASTAAARDDELDEFTDPLALAGGAPPRRPAPAHSASPVAAAGASEAAAAPPTGAGGDDFKAEVERLVQAEVEREQRDAVAFQAEVEALVRQQPTAQCPWGVSTDAGAFLGALGLEQHLDSFRHAGVTPAKLSALLRVDKAQCEQELKKLGVKSLGHRIRIVHSLRS